jgi:hypothetical protein
MARSLYQGDQFKNRHKPVSHNVYPSTQAAANAISDMIQQRILSEAGSISYGLRSYESPKNFFDKIQIYW